MNIGIIIKYTQPSVEGNLSGLQLGHHYMVLDALPDKGLVQVLTLPYGVQSRWVDMSCFSVPDTIGSGEEGMLVIHEDWEGG